MGNSTYPQFLFVNTESRHFSWHFHLPTFSIRAGAGYGLLTAERGRWWNIEKRCLSATFAACRRGRGLRQTDQTDLHSTGQVTARPTSTTSVSPVRNQPKPPNSPSLDHFWQRTAPNEDYRIHGFTRVRLKKNSPCADGPSTQSWKTR